MKIKYNFIKRIKERLLAKQKLETELHGGESFLRS